METANITLNLEIMKFVAIAFVFCFVAVSAEKCKLPMLDYWVLSFVILILLLQNRQVPLWDSCGLLSSRRRHLPSYQDLNQTCSLQRSRRRPSSWIKERPKDALGKEIICEGWWKMAVAQRSCLRFWHRTGRRASWQNQRHVLRMEYWSRQSCSRQCYSSPPHPNLPSRKRKKEKHCPILLRQRTTVSQQSYQNEILLNRFQFKFINEINCVNSYILRHVC